MNSFYKQYAQHYFTDLYLQVPRGKHWRKMPVISRQSSVSMRTPNHHLCTKRLLYTRTYEIEAHDEIREARREFDVRKAEAILDRQQRELDEHVVLARVIAKTWGGVVPDYAYLPDEIDINHPALRCCWHEVREADVFEVVSQRKPRKVYKGGHHGSSHERDEWTVNPYNRTNSKRDAQRDICQGVEDCDGIEADRRYDDWKAERDYYAEYEDEWESEVAFRERMDINNAIDEARIYGHENPLYNAFSKWGAKSWQQHEVTTQDLVFRHLDLRY